MTNSKKVFIVFNKATNTERYCKYCGINISNKPTSTKFCSSYCKRTYKELQELQEPSKPVTKPISNSNRVSLFNNKYKGDKQ